MIQHEALTILKNNSEYLSYDSHFPKVLELSKQHNPNLPETPFNKLRSLIETTLTSNSTEKSLDRIQKFWQNYQEYINIAIHLQKASQLQNIPENDRQQANLYLNKYIEAILPIITAMNTFISTPSEQRTWKKSCIPIDKAIIKFEYSESGIYEESLTALLIAISENKNNWSNEKELRKKIGQDAILRLIEEIGPLEPDKNYGGNMEDTNDHFEFGPSIIGQLEEEKLRFEKALGAETWDAETLKKYEIKLQAMDDAMGTNYFFEFSKIIRNAINGKDASVSENKSTTFDIIIASQKVFECLSLNDLTNFVLLEYSNSEN